MKPIYTTHAHHINNTWTIIYTTHAITNTLHATAYNTPQENPLSTHANHTTTAWATYKQRMETYHNTWHNSHINNTWTKVKCTKHAHPINSFWESYKQLIYSPKYTTHDNTYQQLMNNAYEQHMTHMDTTHAQPRNNSCTSYKKHMSIINTWRAYKQLMQHI